MDWIGTASAALLGAIGVFFTWLTGKQGGTHALEMSDRQASRATDAARVTREQERKAEAYVQALEVSEQVGNWCQSVQPMVVTDPPQALPPLPELAAQVAARARLLAFGSPEVLEAWTDWEDAARTVQMADTYLSFLREEELDGGRGHRLEVHRDLTIEQKPAELAARKALSDRVNLELNQ